MEIIYTEQDYIDSIPSGTCSIGIYPKANGDIHEGHLHIINEAKKIANYVLVTFWNPADFKEELLGVKINDPYVSKIDYNYCISEISNNSNADFIWMHSSSLLTDFFAGQDLPALRQWARDTCNANGYIFPDTSRTNGMYFYMIVWKILKEKGLFKHDKMSSWKDGIITLYRKHFMEKILNKKYYVISPLLRPDGIPYSTGLSLDYKTQSEINDLSSLYQNTKLVNSSDMDNYLITNNVQYEKKELDGITVYEVYKRLLKSFVYVNVVFDNNGVVISGA